MKASNLPVSDERKHQSYERHTTAKYYNQRQQSLISPSVVVVVVIGDGEAVTGVQVLHHGRQSTPNWKTKAMTFFEDVMGNKSLALHSHIHRVISEEDWGP